MSDTSSPEEPENKDDTDADPIIGKAVGSRLKSLFDEFANEDVPDRFLDLIGKLEESERQDNSAGSARSPDDADNAAKGSGKSDQ